MSDPVMKKASLAGIRNLKDEGKLFHDPKASAGEALGVDFWAKAHVEGPRKPRSVHLKLDPEVFDFFYAQAQGKGHLTRMQAVLKAYVKAHTPS